MENKNNTAKCQWCKKEFIKIRANHYFCSPACSQRALRAGKKAVPTHQLNILPALIEKKKQYCNPWNCTQYAVCKKRVQEFVHTTSSSGVWRSVKKCEKKLYDGREFN